MKVILKAKQAGFTLIELMAAMAITAVLVTVIVSLTSRGVDIWRWVIQDVRTTNLARTAMDTMTKDFESMQFRSGNQFQWMLVERDSDLVSKAKKQRRSKANRRKSSSLTQKAPSGMLMGPEGAKVTNASQLLFFTSATDRNPAKSSQEMRRDRIIGDINCVGYKLVYRDQILNEDASKESSGFPVYSLYRNLISADDTVRDMLGQVDLGQAYTSHRDNETSTENFLVENIVEMSLIFEVDSLKHANSSDTKKSTTSETRRETTLVPMMVTGKRMGACSKLEVFGNRLDLMGSGEDVSDLNSGRVVAVTISMTVVTDEGMNVVDQIRQDLRFAPPQEEFFEKYTRSFTQRIALPTAY